VYSATAEDFYYHLDDAHAAGKPFIYVLDSMDALDTRYADKKFHEAKTAARRGTAAKGDYGDGKAKINSTRIRSVVTKLRATGSILVVLSQTRDNIDAGLFEEQQTHAGGRALKFYATVQLWSSVAGRIKRTVRKREVVVGVRVRVRVRKNRITGRERSVEFPIYYDTGIDDIGGMVDWLTTWGYWPVNKSGDINAAAYGDVYAGRPWDRESLIKWVEEEGLRTELEDTVAAAWADVEARVAVQRRSKYE
jgi:recombination protein RecA